MNRTSLFNDLIGRRTNLGPLVGDVFGALAPWTEGGVARPMPLAVYATDDQVVLLAAVPGLRPEDLELTVHQNTVTLSGTLHSEADTVQDATWYVRELPRGTYSRSITLPVPIDADKAEASFEHGILRVVLPKAEAAKPKRIAISAGRRASTSQS